MVLQKTRMRRRRRGHNHNLNQSSQGAPLNKRMPREENDQQKPQKSCFVFLGIICIFSLFITLAGWFVSWCVLHSLKYNEYMHSGTRFIISLRLLKIYFSATFCGLLHVQFQYLFFSLFSGFPSSKTSSYQAASEE